MMNAKKMWPIAAASLVAFTSILSAADQGMMNMKDGEGPDMQICPAAYPRIQGGEWNVMAAGFYWKATEDGLGVAIENQNWLDNPVQFNDAQVVNQNFKWDVGGRFGIGYTFEHDGWDVEFTWTTFHNRSNRSLDISQATDNEQLIPTFSAMPSPCRHCDSPHICTDADASPPSAARNIGPQPTLSISSVDSHWTLDLNYADLDLGRGFWVSRWLEMRPFVGLRALWADQKYGIEYRGGSVDDIAPSFFNFCGASAVDNVKMKSNFKGVGVRAGLDTQWGLGGGWSLFGDFALSMIYGRQTSSFYEWLEATQSGFGKADIAEFEDHTRLSRYVTDLQLGVRYEHTFGERQNYHFTISLGWEHHGFLNFNHFYRFQHISDGGGQYDTTGNFMAGDDGAIFLGNTGEYVITREHGDLTTQGWTLTGKLDF